MQIKSEGNKVQKTKSQSVDCVIVCHRGISLYDY